MKKIKQRIKKKPLLVFMNVFYLLFLISSICIIYSILKIANIENLVRYLVSSLLFLLVVFNSIQAYKIIFKGKNALILLFGTILALLFIGQSYTCGIINGFYSSIDSIYKNSYTYSTSLIVKNDSNIEDIKDVKSIKIGMINDTSSVDGYQIAKEIIDSYKLEKNNEVIKYDSMGEVIKALYDNEINSALVSSTYVSMFSSIDEYQNIKSETKVIYSKTKKIKKLDIKLDKDTKDPISILVMGIDSTVKDISKVTAFNADSLMLITFNPNTYNSTIVSIPRNTYTPISCLSNKPKTKITHSGWYSETCVVKTVSELMDIDIDYYVKINFTGVVNLVDAVDGIEVNVPYSFCEQNSNREWGSKTVYVKKGTQVLNGEQALALSRNRHPNPVCGTEWTNYNSNDFVRGQNQQLVMNALLNKIAKTTDLNKAYSLLNIVGKNVDTNMNTNKILSYYSLLKDIALNTEDNVITFERLYLSTYGKTIYDVLLKTPLSDQVYYNGSLEDIKNEMKINLGLKDPTLVKTFSFSINNKYTPKVIGKGIYNEPSIEVVPNFKNQDKAIVETWALSKNIKVNTIYVDSNTGVQDTVIFQSIPAFSVYDITTTEITIKLNNVVPSDITQ